MDSFIELKSNIISTLSDKIVDNFIESYPMPYKDDTGLNDCFFFYSIDKKNSCFQKINILVLNNISNGAVRIFTDSFPENLQFENEFIIQQRELNFTGREYLEKYKALYEAYEALRKQNITIFSLQKYINHIKPLVAPEIFEKTYRKIMNTVIN